MCPQGGKLHLQIGVNIQAFKHKHSFIGLIWEYIVLPHMYVWEILHVQSMWQILQQIY